MAEEHRLLTVEEVAVKLRCSVSRVQALFDCGLPSVEGIIRGRLVLEEDLWTWVKEQTRAGRPKIVCDEDSK